MERGVYVVDDLLPIRVVNNIESLLLSYEFPWYLQSGTDYFSEDRENDSFQFTHQFVSKSGDISSHWDQVSIILPFVEKTFNFTAIELLRAKSNLHIADKNYPIDGHHPFHTDHDEDDFWSIIYYVNDSDGPTYFRTLDDELKKVIPKKGRIVFFPSNIDHAGSSPINTQFRSNINKIFRIKEND